MKNAAYNHLLGVEYFAGASVRVPIQASGTYLFCRNVARNYNGRKKFYNLTLADA